jgi:hypothetical protein
LPPLTPRPPVVRYERETPGDLLHIDAKKLGKIAVGVVHPKLVRQLLASTEPRVRDAGLAALVLVGDTAHLGRELRRMVRKAGLPADVGQATGVVEVAFWADAETRALVGKFGRAHPALGVRRSAERVCVGRACHDSAV